MPEKVLMCEPGGDNMTRNVDDLKELRGPWLLTPMSLEEDSLPESPYKSQAGHHLDVGLVIPLSRGISQILSIPMDADLQKPQDKLFVLFQAASLWKFVMIENEHRSHFCLLTQ